MAGPPLAARRAARPAGTTVAAAPAMRSPSSAGRRAAAHRRARLLLVEDQLTISFAVREFFALAGYEVDCVAAADEAIGLLEWETYDAVITDLHLTAHRCGEGMKVAWRARQRSPASCIVMLTGHGTETTEEEAYRCGVDVYETKPVELPRLCALVDAALGRDRDARRARELEPKWRQH